MGRLLGVDVAKRQHGAKCLNLTDARAIEMLRDGVFPHDWSLVPVAGKQTHVKGWTKLRLDREKLSWNTRPMGRIAASGL